MLPAMRGQGGGTSVSIDSTAGYRVARNAAVYFATECAVRAFSDGLRKEEANSGIGASLVFFVSTKIELPKHTCPEEIRGSLSPYVGKSELTAEGVASAIVFAASLPKDASTDGLIIFPMHVMS